MGWYEKVSLEFSFSSMIHRIMARSVETYMSPDPGKHDEKLWVFHDKSLTLN
jgi:hypothetical protein